MSRDLWRFSPTEDVLSNAQDPRDPEVCAQILSNGYFVLHEGKTFHQFSDRWEDRPASLLELKKIADRKDWLTPAKFYRLAYRAIARTTDDRTVMFSLLPPATVFGNSAPAHRNPHEVQSWLCLGLLAVANSFSFDWAFRLRGGANVNQFILFSCPLPNFTTARTFLAHQTLRLTSNHAGYAALWREQLGHAWREAGTAFTWPVLSGDNARWAVRAAIDAVVAHAYGLTRDQYAHVLSTFSHSSYKDAPRQCLAAFDELQKIGLEKFTKKHDPYWDIPLNENLPQPVIDLPIPQAAPAEAPRPRTGELFDFQTTAVPASSGALFTEQPVVKRKRKGTTG